MTLSVCVPVYRAHDEPNLRTLAACMPAALDGVQGELIVALNGILAGEAGVPDGAVAVDLGMNRGVGPGWNAAAARSTADVLVFANDDVVLGPRSLAMLHQALLDHPEAGIVGPAGSRFDFATGRHVAWCSTQGVAPAGLVRCDVVSGFMFAVRRAEFEAVGGFDEAYVPATMEEIDLTLAMRHSIGKHPFVVAGVLCEHEFGVSSTPAWRLIRHNGRREFLFTVHRRNRRHFYQKWVGRL
jgi:GT2 family glycosyltransferase